jgi:hypothetical protein
MMLLLPSVLQLAPRVLGLAREKPHTLTDFAEGDQISRNTAKLAKDKGSLFNAAATLNVKLGTLNRRAERPLI